MPPHLEQPLHWKATRWQRRSLTAFTTAIAGELFVTIWQGPFRLSAAAVLYAVFLTTLMQDSRSPKAGALTVLAVLLVRAFVGIFRSVPIVTTLVLESSGALFYLCYDLLLCLQVKVRSQASLPLLWRSFLICDLLSNLEDFILSTLALPNQSQLLFLLFVALVRSSLAICIVMGIRQYRHLLLVETHERRYQRLFLMTANLKNELYFLRKDTEHIEGIMTRAYHLYEELEGQDELSQLALSIAREIHEVKKDHLSIIRGIQSEVDSSYDEEQMTMSDLLHILQDTMGHILGETSRSIVLHCHCTTDFSTQEHYRLMSILKNLVTNGAESIQSGTGRGHIHICAQIQEETLQLTVADNGPGISRRALKHLFQVGYSTKFDPQTGNINRGIGLPAVEFMVKELGGAIQVSSQQSGASGSSGARFCVTIPMARLRREDL